MKNIYRILVVFLIALSCDSDDDNQFKNSCAVDNPVEDLEWLKAEIERRNQNINDDSKYCYISHFIYNNQSIFIYGDCDPRVDKIILVYNCSGESIGFIGDGNFPMETLTEGNIIWKTNNFVCSF